MKLNFLKALMSAILAFIIIPNSVTASSCAFRKSSSKEIEYKITSIEKSEIEIAVETVDGFETETESPETESPETESPETKSPETEAPETEVLETEPVTYEVTLSAYNKEMYVGETYKLIVYVPKEANVSYVTMKYTDNGIISITNGVITAENEGINTVKVYIGEEVVAECKITIKKSCKKIIENVEFICQYPRWPLGCELVSATMALKYAGINVSVNDFIAYVDLHAYPYVNSAGIRIGYDPNLYFAGDPYTYTAWGCFAECIYNAIIKIPGIENYKVELLYDKSVEELCKTYIDNDIPVIFWATEGMAKPYAGRTWYIAETDEWFTWTNPEHCLLLVGYDDNYYYFNDPEMGSANKAYSKYNVEVAYEGLGKQAVVVYKNK